MLNHNSFLKNISVVIILLVSTLLALPNLYGEDPSVQISPKRGSEINDQLTQNISNILKQAEITPKAIEQTDDHLLVRLDNTTQLRAKDLIDRAISNQYNTAPNLAPALPKWLDSLGLNRMYLGLDLRGGVHFLLKVDMDSVINQALENHGDDLRILFTDNKIPFVKIETPATQNDITSKSIKIQFPNAEALRQAQGEIDKHLALSLLVWQANNNTLTAQLSDLDISEKQKNALETNITTLRNRVNELGVAEPVIQQQGNDRIIVELPGVQDTTKAKEILGTTATLEFRMVDDSRTQDEIRVFAANGKAPLGTKLYWDRNKTPYLLKRQVILTGNSIIGATAQISQNTNGPEVAITLDSTGAEKFAVATKNNVGKPMATVLIENQTFTEIENGEAVKKTITVEEIANVAVIQTQLFKNFVITGLDSLEEANNLALILRSGALAAPIQIIEERTVGPSTGKENIDKGFTASVYALVLVMCFMLIRYRTFGIVANIALCVNLILIIALLSLLQATLTLPGIAGIILSLGMSVDANVLIFERIRENLRNGVSIQNAISEGFDRAMATITDANLTSLIAAIVLFGIGSGPIKGFAVTLSLGIITSMFTAIILARMIVNIFWGGRKLKSLPIGNKEVFSFFVGAKNFNFMKYGKISIIAAFLVIAASAAAIVGKGFNFGLDFTGGTLIEASFKTPVDVEEIKEDFANTSLESPQVQYFGSAHEILIRLPVKDGVDSASISTSVLDTLKIHYPDVEIQRVEFVGPQVGNELVFYGSLASIVAILFILLYIWIRFEWKLALGTILSTVHDTMFLILAFILFNVEFDLTTLAAVLAVIGYSVNDSVVILDRIRENFRSSRINDAKEIINTATSQTMSRTIMTSFTTLIAVVALYLFGGSSVHSFSLAMILGIAVGTYSSIFIAAATSVALGLKKEDLMQQTKENNPELFDGMP